MVQHDVVCSNSSIVGTSSLDVAAMCLGADGLISAVLIGESKAKGKCFALMTVVVIIEKCGKAATLIMLLPMSAVLSSSVSF